jgi:predicted aspartyl protease
MNRRLFLLLLATVMAVRGLDGRSLPSSMVPEPSMQVPLLIDREGFITILARIGEAGPFKLLLDTGSNRSAVSARVARRLGLAPVARTSVVTSGGSQDGQIVRLPSIGLGIVTKRDLLAFVIDEPGLTAAGVDLDGVLGQDFLMDQTYTLDYRHRRLVWHTSSPIDGRGVRLALSHDEGRWLVDLPQLGVSRNVRMVPDSGASGLVLFDRGTLLPLPVTRVSQSASVTSITGSLQTRAAVVTQMSIGTIILRDRPALVVDRRDPAAPAGDGLLPLSMFASVTFDATQNALLVREQ